MKRIALLAVLAATAALPAHANTGIGLLVMWIPAAIAALIPAILVEAAIFTRLLAQKLDRALWISTVANVASTLAGAVIAILVDIALFWSTGSSGAEWGRAPLLIALVPMFFVTWWLETKVVRRMQPAESKALARRASLVANLVTYAGMAIGVFLLVAPAGGSVNRVHISEVLAAMGVAKADIAEQFQANKTWPAPRNYEPGRYARSLSADANGRIVVVLSFPGSPDGDGKHIVYEPRVEKGIIVEWRCSSPDLAPKYLPAACR